MIVMRVDKSSSCVFRLRKWQIYENDSFQVISFKACFDKNGICIVSIEGFIISGKVLFNLILSNFGICD